MEAKEEEKLKTFDRFLSEIIRLNLTVSTVLMLYNNIQYWLRQRYQIEVSELEQNQRIVIPYDLWHDDDEKFE